METTATSINLPAFAAPEMDVPQKRGGEVNNDRTPGRRDAAQGIGSHGARGPIGRMYRSRHSAPVHGHYSGVLLLGHLDTQTPLVASQIACRGD